MNKVMILDYNDIDTDIIIPTQFLKVTTREGLGKYAFYEWRYDSDGNKLDHITNTNDDKSYNVIITKRNFGCGSSREHAAWALSDYGIDIIIAASYSDIFYRNWLNNFKLPIILDIKEIEEIIKSDNISVEVDLNNKEVTINNKKYPIKISDKVQKKLINKIDDIDYTLQYQEKITKYETYNKI